MVNTPFSTVSFFFQAEDGIRDLTVTGVQTCALPISRRPHEPQNSCCRARGRRHGGEEASVVRRIVLIRSEEPLQEGWRRRAFGPAGAPLGSPIRVAGAGVCAAEPPPPAAAPPGAPSP